MRSATVYRWPDGSYVRDGQGNYTMLFEGVTEERYGKPWNTEVFAIKVDPRLTSAGGTLVLFKTPENPERPPHILKPAHA
ncbi:MAG: hypothetical protein HC902_12310 [Calothrix sp. SM1_5_4]|nr:hypothetical protein [Calothrix sp. SM1_5_4]